MKITRRSSAEGPFRFAFGLGLLACAVMGASCGAPSAPAPEAPPAATAAAAAATATPAETAAATPAATAPPESTPAETPATTPATTPAATPAASASALPPFAPDIFEVKFDTSQGVVVAAFHKSWAPLGVQRMYDLVNAKFFDGARFFRVISGFVVQFGIAGDPALDREWAGRNLRDEPLKHSNTRGTITFANSGANSRSTQLFINLADNNSSNPRANLDSMTGFVPIGEVVEGMDLVDKFFSLYGESASNEQQMIHQGGNAFLNQSYPKLDYIKTATIESP